MDVFEVFLIAAGPHFAFIVKGVSQIIDIGGILYSLNRIRDLAYALNAADKDILALGNSLPYIVNIVSGKGVLDRMMCILFLNM